MSGETISRGYGYKHRMLRERLLPQAIGTPCSRCGKPMLQGQALDLDHNDNRRGYQGFSHNSCNRRAGGLKSAAIAHPTNPKPRSSTNWG